MHQPHILLVTTALDPANGPGVVMTNLAVGLTARGFRCSLVSTHGPTTSPLISEAKQAGIDVRHLDMRSIVDPRGLSRLRKIVRETKPDLVHSRNMRADVMTRVAGRRGIPLVNNIVNQYPDESITMHGRQLGRLVLTAARWSQGRCDVFAANSESVATSITREFKIDPERVRVVYDGVRLEKWRGADPADLREVRGGGGTIVCLTTARLHPQKDIATLIEAALIVKERRPDVRFAIAGEGPLRSELETSIEKAGLSETVYLLGWRGDVPELMAASDIFVFPSRFEGLPSSVIEAMAAGLPVVASRVPGVKELVDHGRTGLLVPGASPTALAEAIVGLTPDQVRDLGDRSRERAERMFSAEVMTESFIALYGDLGIGIS